MVAASSLCFAQVAVDDFLPRTQGGPEDVKQPDKVEIEGDTVTAATAQDAINVAVEENTKNLSGAGDKALTTPEIGVKIVEFPSGDGFVATGMGVYPHMPNPTATRVAQRNAYVIAYVNAKAALARFLSEGSTESDTILESMARDTMTDEESENMTSDGLQQRIRQASQAVLKGYMTYEIEEISDEVNEQVRSVYVSIVSTRKTRGELMRRGAAVETDKLTTGIQQVLDEVKQGLVPPVGGRILTVPTTGQTAFIGFGSAVIQTSPNRAMAAKMKVNAQKIALVRSRDALFGIIGGDKVMWQTGVSDKGSQGYEQALSYTKKDPVAQDVGEVSQMLKSYQASFERSTEMQETIRTYRKGVLPQGIQEKTWLSTENDWAYSMAVYYPPLSDFAAKTAREMREAQIIQPVDDGSRKPSTGAAGGSAGTGARSGAGAADPPTRTVDGRVKKLKGGKISPDDDL